MSELLSIRQYAKHRGCSHVAVGKHVRAGKLTLVDGKIDPVRADEEWARNIEPRALRAPRVPAQQPGQQQQKTEKKQAVSQKPSAEMTRLSTTIKPAASAGHAQGMRSAPEAESDAGQYGDDDGSEGGQVKHYDLMFEKAKREHHLAEMARMEREQLEGRLIDKNAAVQAWTGVFTEAKTRLLGVPSKAKQRIPHLTAEEIEILGDLIRQALEEVTECPPTVSVN